ncbi:MAG: hypothetical protein AAGI54_09925 [Planctomycetota bacterium]
MNDHSISAEGQPVFSDYPLDAQGRLAVSVACRECGYDVRQAMPTGRCPECGASVEWSLIGDLLRSADPDWLRGIRLGIRRLVILILAIYPLSIVAVLLGAVVPIVGVVLIIAITIFALIYLMMSYWGMTLPEPGRADGGPLSRRLARLGLFWGSFAGIAVGIVSAVLDSGGSAPVALVAVLGVVQLVLGIGILVGFISLFFFARSLALRVPNTSLAKQTMIVLWGLVGVYILFIVFLIVTLAVVGFNAATGSSGTGGASPAAQVGSVVTVAGSCAMMLGLLAFVVWAIVLAFWYMRVLKRAEEQSLRKGALGIAGTPGLS